MERTGYCLAITIPVAHMGLRIRAYKMYQVLWNRLSFLFVKALLETPGEFLSAPLFMAEYTIDF